MLVQVQARRGIASQENVIEVAVCVMVVEAGVVTVYVPAGQTTRAGAWSSRARVNRIEVMIGAFQREISSPRFK